MSDYLLDKEFEDAESRLTIQEELQDPATVEYLNKIGVTKGWHCLEIGAGRGSIAAWLCRKVGSKGKVTAIDIDARFLKTCSFDNIEIVEEDIRRYDPEEGKYDLIHARDVLVHIVNREILLQKIMRWLKYGGWILLEEPDVITDAADPSSPADIQELYQKVTESIYRFLQGKGLDPYFGRKIFGILKSSGFASLHAEGRVHMFSGGTDQGKSPHMMAFEQLKDALVSEGFVTESEFLKFFELANNPSFAWREGLTMSVWGQCDKQV
jgi:ubiquinone/menaquinone biosynthesis C-methylase UbiE